MKIIDLLENYKLELEQKISVASKMSAHLPKGTVRIIKHKGKPQYYLVGEKISYLTKKDMKLVKELAQREYNRKVLIRLKAQLKSCKGFLKICQKNKLEAPFERASFYRKALITPLFTSDFEFGRQWKLLEYEQKSFSENAPEYYTSSGLRVRSKSELIIGDVLERLGIYFRYEFPLKMNNGVELHPDFYCLNVRTRQEFVWEHFGMMDDLEYVQRAVEKQVLYAKNGWLIGKNLIFTMETMYSPLNSKMIEKIVRECLM
ncbi:MAG: hypothetical protein MR958_04195 [Spirochaetia bacterium]|nr:hypothetical protein [Spirochaetia bacterium]MDD7269988.1 hypothetical protein [Treponema sp.]MDY4984711.1 hypothetical protein [Treponema sp.]